MPVLAALIIAALGWALWKGKIRFEQIPPILLSLAGAFLAARGQFIFGIGAVVAGVTWYRGMTWRLFGLNSKQSEQYAIDKARWLLGVGANDDAERIRARHRLLMAQNHPDRGGTEESAAQLNEARDLLLAKLLEKQP
jgi:hypothetical protein